MLLLEILCRGILSLRSLSSITTNKRCKPPDNAVVVESVAALKKPFIRCSVHAPTMLFPIRSFSCQ